MKPKIIIVEGPQGTGKTTVTNRLRELIPYSNLYRMSGHNDATPSGYYKSRNMYDALMSYLWSINGCGMNIIFDRIFITEIVYCNLKYRQYYFNDIGNDLLYSLNRLSQYFDIYIFNLTLHDPKEYGRRLMRDKAQHHSVEFTIDNSMRQQSEYMHVMNEIHNSFPSLKVVHIYTDRCDAVDEIMKYITGGGSPTLQDNDREPYKG